MGRLWSGEQRGLGVVQRMMGGKHSKAHHVDPCIWNMHCGEETEYGEAEKRGQRRKVGRAVCKRWWSECSPGCHKAKYCAGEVRGNLWGHGANKTTVKNTWGWTGCTGQPKPGANTQRVDQRNTKISESEEFSFMRTFYLIETNVPIQVWFMLQLCQHQVLKHDETLTPHVQERTCSISWKKINQSLDRNLARPVRNQSPCLFKMPFLFSIH